MNSPILLVAYQCGPNMGSVSQIGWEWYSRLCDKHPVTLVTHMRNRAALEQAGAPLANSEIIYIDTEWFAGPLYRVAKRIFPRSEHSVFLVSSLDYFVFDWAAYQQLRQRIRLGANWSLLHRTTPVTLSAPTWLSRLGLPTVIGPLNSGLQNPANFDHIMQQESAWLIKLRSLSRIWDIVSGSSRHISRMLIASRATLQAIAPQYQARCSMMLENGVDLTRFKATPWPAPPDKTQALKILFTGRLIPLKGLDMLLQAIHRLRQNHINIELNIVGDGPMKSEWQQLSQQLGIADCVLFHGALPLDAVAQHMADCHVFCLPSVRESGGAVLLEAMACARPVIALNFGGPSEIVHNNIGKLLDMHNPQQVINDLVIAFSCIVVQPETWRQRGLNGRREVEAKYSWTAKVEAIEGIYAEVCETGIN